MLVSNVYLVTTSQVRCSVVVVVVIIIIIIIIIDVVLFTVVVIVVLLLLLLPTSFCFLLSSSPLVISGNILFYFYSATQSAFMNSQTSFQSFINSINMKWLPPTLKSLGISFRKIGEAEKLRNSHK
jgi:archaellum biogenesis protein FlaJ (TadC family)